MFKQFLVFSTIIPLIWTAIVLKLTDKKAFVFSQFMDKCYNRKLSTHYENITLHPSANNFTFDYNFVVDKNVNTSVLLFKFKKCPNAESLDACSSFPVFRATNFCGLMTSEKDVWSPIMMCATPRIACPFRKGIYRGRNCRVDLEAFKFFPLTQGYWHLDAEIMDERNSPVFCIRNQGNAIRV